MKKVLILAYDFPPYVSVGGLRPYSWYKYFNEFGVYPIVVTRQWGNKHGNSLDYLEASSSKETVLESTESGLIFRTPYNPNLANIILLKYGKNKFIWLRKFLSAYYELFQWFYNIGPKVKLYKEAKRFLSENKIDVILATGEPYILFKYASKLSEKFNIPWIADYRDPWSQEKNRSSNIVLQILNNILEKKYLKNVKFIFTVSEFFKEQISSLLKNKKIYIIQNGFDFDLRLIENKQNNENFTISFVGSLLKWHPIESFLKVVSWFIDSNNISTIRLKFYGVNNSEVILKLINEKYYNLKNIIILIPSLKNEELVSKLLQDNVFLLFNYYSYMGTKIYDYIGLKRKILFCYSDDSEANLLKKKYYNIKEIAGCSNHLQEDLIKETNSGIIVKDANHLKTVLEELYNEFIKKGYIECNSIGVEKYSRKIQCEKLAKIIKSLK